MISILYKFIESDAAAINNPSIAQNQKPQQKMTKEQIKQELMKKQDTPVKPANEVINANTDELSARIDRMIDANPELAKKIVERFMQTHDIRSVNGAGEVLRQVAWEEQRKTAIAQRMALQKIGTVARYRNGGIRSMFSGQSLFMAALMSGGSLMGFAANFARMITSGAVGSAFGTVASAATFIIPMVLQTFKIATPTICGIGIIPAVGIGLFCASFVGLLFKKSEKVEADANNPQTKEQLINKVQQAVNQQNQNQQTKESYEQDMNFIKRNLYLETIHLSQSINMVNEGAIANKLNSYATSKLQQIKKMNDSSKSKYLKKLLTPLLYILAIGVLLLVVVLRYVN